ncbi:MAG: metallophosphoesterase family protein [Balneolales bacterium]
MQNQKFIAIGDIHGCVKSTLALLEKLQPWNDRTYIFIGDYIDRGPASREVVDFLIEFNKSYPCVFLRGNHEQMLLDSFSSGDSRLWLYNGGDTTLKSYSSDGNTLADHQEFYMGTRLYYDTDKYFFVHAGLHPTKTIAESIAQEDSQEEFLWERSHIKTTKNKWEKTVVFGHTPVPEPIVKPHMMGIDTGCVYTHRQDMGKLTAVLLPEQKFIYQECLDDI